MPLPGGLPAPVGRLLSAPGPGEPLPVQVQAPLERSFGAGLGAVRVHGDAQASGVAQSLSARAFTYGPNVFLGPGERSTDLGLMAHEVTHVVHQQAAPVVQRLAPNAPADAFEQEARQVSAAVQRGDTVAVRGRTGSPAIQRDWVPGFVRRGVSAVGSGIRAVGGAVVSGVKAVGSAVADLGAAALQKALDYVKERARSIPGYDLLGFILGRDPITQAPIDRNAINLIRALLGLIPGGAAMFQNLQQANVIQRAYEWFSAEIVKLNLTWPVIRGLFQQAWDALGPGDLLNPSGAWEKIKAIFGPPLGRLKDFALEAGHKILEFIFEGALALAGGAGQRVLGIFRRIGDTFKLIVKDPVGFLGNLLTAVKGGFRQFSAHIIEHLKTALFEWLFGALAGAGLKLPAKFDLMGIISIVLQVLGLTYAQLRQRLVQLIGETAVSFLERAFEFLRVLVTEGLAAAWQKLLEFATGLIDMVIEGIRNWVARSIVGAAITKLVTMFNPVGAIIQSIITIYNTVMFFIERAQQIAALVESIVDSVQNIAQGNLTAAINYVERTMARTLPVIISFLARLIGLGSVSSYIKDIIQRIQAVVTRARDRVIDWIVAQGRRLFTGASGKPSTSAGTDRAAQVQAGLAALDQEDARLQREGKLTRGDAEQVAVTVKRTYPVFTALTVVDGGDTWDYEYAASPGTTKKGPAKAGAAAGSHTGTAVLSAATRTQAQQELSQITSPAQVNAALESLAELESNILDRYKGAQDGYVLYLKGKSNGDTFDWPLSYLRRRASLKLGKAGESEWITKVYPGAGKNSQAFRVKQDDGTLADRIPDVLTTAVVADVKDAKDLSFDAQLRDFYAIAKARQFPGKVQRMDGSAVGWARRFEAVVRHKSHSEGETTISGPLSAVLDATHRVITDKDVKTK